LKDEGREGGEKDRGRKEKGMKLRSAISSISSLHCWCIMPQAEIHRYHQPLEVWSWSGLGEGLKPTLINCIILVRADKNCLSHLPHLRETK
jgi:hypothetical protein